MLTVVLVSLGALGLVSLVEELRVRSSKRDAAAARAERDAMQVRIDHVEARARSAEDVSIELGKRLDRVTIEFRAQVAALEADLQTCADPAAVRGRLNTFFGESKG